MAIKSVVQSGVDEKSDSKKQSALDTQADVTTEIESKMRSGVDTKSEARLSVDPELTFWNKDLRIPMRSHAYYPILYIQTTACIHENCYMKNMLVYGSIISYTIKFKRKIVWWRMHM